MGGWVFAYGSLMWDPGVPVCESVTARLEGYARSFCLRSLRHRGTPEVPGLVLGLEQAAGAACTGLAFRVADADWQAALANLRERELVDMDIPALTARVREWRQRIATLRPA